MNLFADDRNPFLQAYDLVRRSGLLRTAVGQNLFKSAYFLYKRYIEDDLRDLLHVHPGIVGDGEVLDIGANIGYTAAVLARVIKPGRKVFAFEPEPFNFGLLQRVANRREFRDKIVPAQLAVGSADGTINLWINDHHHADHRVITNEFRTAHASANEVSVSMVSIDSFVRSNPGPISFVKIDVQGYELEVCKGMEETLRQNAEITVVLEFTPSSMREMGFDPLHLIDFFASRAFKVYEIHSRGKLTEGVPVAKEDSDYFDLLFSRRNLPA